MLLLPSPTAARQLSALPQTLCVEPLLNDQNNKSGINVKTLYMANRKEVYILLIKKNALIEVVKCNFFLRKEHKHKIVHARIILKLISKNCIVKVLNYLNRINVGPDEGF
jgi:hypothetical protein